MPQISAKKTTVSSNTKTKGGHQAKSLTKNSFKQTDLVSTRFPEEMADELSFSAITDNPQKVRKALQILTSSKPKTSSRSSLVSSGSTKNSKPETSSRTSLVSSGSTKNYKPETSSRTSLVSSGNTKNSKPETSSRTSLVSSGNTKNSEPETSSRSSLVSSGNTKNSKPETSSRSTKNCNVPGPSKAEATRESEECRYFSFLGSCMVTGPLVLAVLTTLICLACVDNPHAENVMKHFFLIATVYSLAKYM